MPYAMLSENDGIVAYKRPQRCKLQSGATEPVAQQLMSITGPARANYLDIRSG